MKRRFIFFALFAWCVPAGAHEIRVLLDHISQGDLHVEVPEGGFTVTRQDGQIPVSQEGALRVADGLIVTSNDGRHLYWRGKPYRGRLEVTRMPDGRMGLVNVLDIEDYLYGVLASEVDTKTWPMEALKAQAVASRSYALHKIGMDPLASFNIGTKSSHQVYWGAGVEDTRAKEAVDETRGLVLLDDQGAVVAGYFHSCCGGRTEDIRDVWGGSVNNIISVSDFGSCQMSPHYSWATTLPLAELGAVLRRLGYTFHEPIKSFLIGEMTKSRRVLNFKVITANGRLIVPAERLRQALGPNWMKSTKLTQIQFKNGRFVIHGNGWGHGVGLCQWGAKSMADKYWDYKRILRRYFPKADVGRTSG